MAEDGGMNLQMYQSMRGIELQRIWLQRQFIWFIGKHMPEVNLSALRHFSDAHIKATQLRMYYIRYAYFARGEGSELQIHK